MKAPTLFAWLLVTANAFAIDLPAGLRPPEILVTPEEARRERILPFYVDEEAAELDAGARYCRDLQRAEVKNFVSYVRHPRWNYVRTLTAYDWALKPRILVATGKRSVRMNARKEIEVHVRPRDQGCEYMTAEQMLAHLYLVSDCVVKRGDGCADDVESEI